MPEPGGKPPSAPRWVKISALTVGVLLLLAVAAKLTGLGGDHGPGRHMDGRGLDDRGTPVAEVHSR